MHETNDTQHLFGETPLAKMTVKDTIAITSICNLDDLPKTEYKYGHDITQYFASLGFNPFFVIKRKKTTGSGGHYIGIVFEAVSDTLLALIQNTDFKNLFLLKKQPIIHFMKLVTYIPEVQIPHTDSVGVKKELCERACFISPAEQKVLSTEEAIAVIDRWSLTHLRSVCQFPRFVIDQRITIVYQNKQSETCLQSSAVQSPLSFAQTQEEVLA